MYIHKNPAGSGQETVTTDYLNGFQYESKQINSALVAATLKFVPTAEGYYDFEKNQYIYSYTDHLGNIRVSYFKNTNGSAEVLEENNFYPFGMKHEGYNQTTGNPAYGYQYNGKELQKETGWSDYGARMYMSDIARWGVIDPLAELMRTYSPYTYAYNNPISFIDPDGRKPVTPDQEGVGGFAAGGFASYFAGGGSGSVKALHTFFGSEDGLGAFYNTGASSGGGGGSYSTFGQTPAYAAMMNAWRNGQSFNLVNSGGYLKWWTDLGHEKEGLIGTFNAWRLNPYKYDSEMHKNSQTLRSWSGYAFSANKFVFQPAAERALLYGAGEAYSTTNLVFEKALPKLISSRRIYVPLMEISVKNAQRLAVGTKVAGRVLGGGALILASVDMAQM